MKIGLLSFRIAGLDGVSLEIKRWKTILGRMGHCITPIAGELDEPGILIPPLSFATPENNHLRQLLANDVNYPKVEKKAFELADEIEKELTRAFTKNKFDRLIVSNIFSLPIHFSLAIALEKVIGNFQIQTVSRNHDFWWERKSYLKENWLPFFTRYFPPPENPLITHITINHIAQAEFKKRTKMDSLIISDTFDYANKDLLISDDYSKRWKNDFGLKQNDIVFVQATRIVPRKKIELSIELVKRLANPNIVLVVCGQAGDEGIDYIEHLKRLAKGSQIRAKFIGDYIGSQRETKNGINYYTLWDCLRNCDLMTYPSASEGFGNQFLEAVYFKKPIFINRYPVYKTDIEPLGFKTIAINGKITLKTLEDVKNILGSLQLQEEIVEGNFKIAEKHFSFEATQRKLEKLGF